VKKPEGRPHANVSAAYSTTMSTSARGGVGHHTNDRHGQLTRFASSNTILSSVNSNNSRFLKNKSYSLDTLPTVPRIDTIHEVVSSNNEERLGLSVDKEIREEEELSVDPNDTHLLPSHHDDNTMILLKIDRGEQADSKSINSDKSESRTPPTRPSDPPPPPPPPPLVLSVELEAESIEPIELSLSAKKCSGSESVNLTLIDTVVHNSELQLCDAKSETENNRGIEEEERSISSVGGDSDEVFYENESHETSPNNELEEQTD
jgi:hypothetical protein